MIVRGASLTGIVAGLCLLFFCGCGHRQTLVEIADRAQQYRVGNGAEPSDLDPQIAIGQPEHDIMLSLYEGLVYGDAKDVSPRPGVAERWDISPDGLVYIFHLRKNARWSNGQPVTARDFYESYHRLLMPSLAVQYSYMLYPVTNAEAFNTGKITNFDLVGFKVLDDYTLQLTLHSPTPYLLKTEVPNLREGISIVTLSFATGCPGLLEVLLSGHDSSRVVEFLGHPHFGQLHEFLYLGAGFRQQLIFDGAVDHDFRDAQAA